MNKDKAIAQLLDVKRQVTFAHMNYLSSIREYAPGEEMYMREAHFIMAVPTQEAITATELSDKLQVTLGAVSQLASRLEKKGYITRNKSAQDRRQTMVSLTQKGLDLYARHKAYDEKCIAEIVKIFEEFTDEDMQKFIKYEQLMNVAFCTNK